mmetsp:Transcript_7976/g.22431  ORF Transcript_7976/g.22431 Transcript_7976/m.22431 type:complete len:567 (-) Transcript_7976:157-1857(-)
MGCSASTKKFNQVHTIEDANFISTHSEVGFNKEVFHRFAIPRRGSPGSPPDELTLNTLTTYERTALDEIRVLRVSSLSGQVTLYVAGGAVKKPVQYSMERSCPRAAEQPLVSNHCPFCPGNERNTPPDVLCFDCEGKEICRANGDDWLVRVFPNIFPMLICPLELYGEAHREALDEIPHSGVARGQHANVKVSHEPNNPTCLQVNAMGASEVFVESPLHNALLALQEPKLIAVLFKAVAQRGRVLSQYPWVKQLLYFKQWGPLSGGSLVHPHTQVVSLPVLPPPLQSRLEYGLHIYSTRGKCATCLTCVDPFVQRQNAHQGDPAFAPAMSINSSRGGELPKAETDDSPDSDPSSRLVHATKHFVVIVPYAASSQYCMTVAPIRHCADFLDITPEEITDLSEVLALITQAIYYGLDDPSYNLFIRSAPSMDSLRIRGRDVSREDIRRSFHWSLEVRPRFPADLGGFEIASGIRVVTGLPEDHAAELRTWVRERLQANVVPVPPRAPPQDVKRPSSKNSNIFPLLAPRETPSPIVPHRPRSKSHCFIPARAPSLQSCPCENGFERNIS